MPNTLLSRSTTLTQRLVALFVLFSALPLFLSNVWGYLQSKEYLTEQAYRNVRGAAALEASRTLVFVDAKRDLVPALVAGNLHLFGLLRSLQSQTDPQIVAAVQRALAKQLLLARSAADEDVQHFFVLSPEGRLMASTEEGHVFREDRSQEPCFRAGSKGPGVVGFEHFTQPPTLVAAAPVADEFGKVWGVFCARFDFNLHHELSAGRELRTRAAALYLVDATARVVDAVVEEGPPATLGVKLERLRPLHAGTLSWEARYLLPSGEEVIGAFHPVPNLGWGVLVEIPVERALATLTRFRWQAASVDVLVTALVLVLVVLAAGSVTGPIRRLSSAAQKVAEGGLGERVPTEGPREILELAESFNRMSLSLRESHQLLEQRVADATAELRQSQEFTELLLNSIDQRVVVIDRELTIIKANQVALAAYGADVVGRRCDQPGAGGGPAGCGPGSVRHTLETGEPTTAERPEAGPQGPEILRLDTRRVAAGPGEAEAVVLVGRVVTAEKRLQAELEKMATFGRLAAGVAHEVGNPLASIAAQLRMNREASDPARVRQTFSVVERQVERVTQLLRELMTFARKRRDDVTLVQLNDVVEDVARLVAHDWRTQSTVIETHLATALPGVRAKEDPLTQVLLNLTLNAIDAMAGSGTLTIETSSEGGLVTCRVRDTGPGISPEILPRLFQAFFTTKEAGRGTGLGLFVSRNLVEGFGGTLEIEHTSPQGTVFAVRLPMAARAPAASG